MGEINTRPAALAFLIKSSSAWEKQLPQYNLFMQSVGDLIFSWQDPDVGLLKANDRKSEDNLTDAFHHAFVQSGLRTHRTKLLTAFTNLMKQITDFPPRNDLKIEFIPINKFNHKAKIKFTVNDKKYFAELEGKRINEKFPILTAQVWTSGETVEKENILGTVLIGCDNNVKQSPHLDISDNITKNLNGKWVHHYPLSNTWNNGKEMGGFIEDLFIRFIKPVSIQY